MNRSLLILSFSLLSAARGQEVFSDRIKGVRLSSALQAEFPVVIQDSTSILLEFDTDASWPEDFKLKWYHCDRSWNTTRSSFINDQVRNVSRFPLSYEVAPTGVRHYRFHYTVRIPGISALERFPFSGNYQFELWNQNENELLAQFRLFVVERTLRPTMKIVNRQLPSLEHPWNKAHKVEVQVVLPERIAQPPTSTTTGTGAWELQTRQEYLLPILVNAVDVYKNRELIHPYRIEVNKPSPNTFVYGIGTRRLRFVADHLRPGNEYRRLDLRNVDDYPPDGPVRPKLGADVSRMQFRASQDQDGVAILTQGNRYADYLSFQFEFVDETRDGQDSIYVVGEFNGWTPTPKSLMHYDPRSKRFVWQTSLRRGQYDYQYVLGNDWIVLEGNDWRTLNVYSALVYYRDERYGGFDRIVGFVQAKNAGSNEAAE